MFQTNELGNKFQFLVMVHPHDKQIETSIVREIFRAET